MDRDVLKSASIREIPGGPRDVWDALRRASTDFPDREALVCRYRRLTFRELYHAADSCAAKLADMGLKTGERVAASAANHSDIVIAYLATQRLGAVWVGVNRNLAASEKQFILGDCEAAFFLADIQAREQISPVLESLPALRCIVDLDPGASIAHHDPGFGVDKGGAAPRSVIGQIDPHAPSAIAYTSGTTGFPKGVVHSQHNQVLVGAVARHEGRIGQDMRVGVALPLTILNLMIVGPLQSIIGGATCICMDRIDSLGLADWIKSERIETFAAVPTMIHDLITNPNIRQEDLKSLKRPAAGAAATPDSFRQMYRERFGAELQSGYGLTEAPTTVAMTDPQQRHPANSSGRALAHVEVAILDSNGAPVPAGESGEICVRAHKAGHWAGVYSPMLGYWKRPDASAQALLGGWLHTGDVGRFDDSANLFVEGRRNDVIVRGGAKIYPAEIERVLHLDARVSACAAVGRANERLGETVTAFVQPAAGVHASDDLRKELDDHCRLHLARYKLPDEWIFVEEMPRNAMNKIVKADLAGRYFSGASTSNSLHSSG